MESKSLLFIDHMADPKESIIFAKTTGVMNIIPCLVDEGYLVELVPKVRYKFRSFEGYRNRLIKKFERIKRKVDEYLFEPYYEYLRTSPLTSMRQMEEYDAIIAHPNFKDADFIRRFALRMECPPILWPAGEDFEGMPDFPIEGVYEHPPESDNKNIYLVRSGGMLDFGNRTLELLAYLLDEKEQTRCLKTIQKGL